METGVKETLCTHCEHGFVCKYKDACLKVFEEADNVFRGTQFSYELKCPNFVKKQVNLRSI